MLVTIETHNSADYTYASGILSRKGYEDVAYKTYVLDISDTDRDSIVILVTETLLRILRERPNENIPV